MDEDNDDDSDDQYDDDSDDEDDDDNSDGCTDNGDLPFQTLGAAHVHLLFTSNELAPPLIDGPHPILAPPLIDGPHPISNYNFCFLYRLI